MISKPVMQNTVDGIASITGRSVGVYDPDGRLIASSLNGQDTVREENEAAREVALGVADVQEIRGDLYFRILDDERPEYVLVLAGADEMTRSFGRMAAFQLTGLVDAYRERFDEDHYYKNLLLDNLLLVDIYSRAGKLQIPARAPRVCLAIRSERPWEPEQLEILRSGIAPDSGDVLTEIDDKNVVIVHTLPDPQEEETGRKTGIREYCAEKMQRFTDEGISGIRIASGPVVSDLRDVSQSYKEACMALDVSRIFDPEAGVISYDDQGLGRLVYQLPPSLCRTFLRDTFGEYRPEEEDEEIRQTIEAFFRNNLNISEAARELFIHRNTLIYRLEKIQRLTGLDIRLMEDAMKYRIAAMVVRYMKYMEA